MRRVTTVLLVFSISALFCGCANEKKEPVLYVHRSFLDRDAGGYTLHILASEDVSLSIVKDDVTESDSAREMDTPSLSTWVSYGGKTPEEPFEAFLKENPHAYTASIERYMWGQALSAEDRYRITRYLMDTPPWPLARPGFPAYDE